eukprot:g13180.t1
MQLATSTCQRVLQELGGYDSESPSHSVSPNHFPLAEGGEWAMGPKGGGVFPAGRFQVEPDLAKRSTTRDAQEDYSLGDFGKQYVLGKQIGKGSQGVVHVCHHRESGACKAVKMLDRKNKTAWATYKREARPGENRAPTQGWREFVDAERCYVIMEKFEGHLRKALKWVAKETGDETAGLDALSLGNVMKQARVPTVYRYGAATAARGRPNAEVLSAILHLHTCGVVHRDVKAHNLLIDRCDLRDPRCRVVLSDFGLARRLEPGRFLCAQVGTRKYWAPELYEKKYWHVVDVFAIGVLMFLAASNSYPFQDEDQTKNRDVFEQDLAGGPGLAWPKTELPTTEPAAGGPRGMRRAELRDHSYHRDPTAYCHPILGFMSQGVGAIHTRPGVFNGSPKEKEAGLLPPLNDRQLNPPRKQRPLKPVLRSTKAFGGSRLSPDLRDFFAMACRRYNPHETSFHMEARIGFRRPKSFVRLRPLAPGTSSCGDLAAPNMEAAPWGALKRLKGSSVVQSQPILSTPQSRQSRQTQDDEVHELLVDLEETNRVAADAIGKVFRDAFAKDGGWHRAE